MMAHALASTTLRSQIPQVFQVISHIVGFRSVLRVVNLFVVANHLLNF